jgi:membrane protein implicated in regulation of membrane protease activity
VLVRDLSAVGCLGVISVATRGAAGTGEVVLSIRGGTESYLAWSDEPLPKGTHIVVLDVRGARTVQVAPAETLGLSSGPVRP